METDTQPPQNGDVGENTPPRRRSRFEEAPEDVKGNIPPPGRLDFVILCVSNAGFQVRSWNCPDDEAPRTARPPRGPADPQAIDEREHGRGTPILLQQRSS